MRSSGTRKRARAGAGDGENSTSTSKAPPATTSSAAAAGPSPRPQRRSRAANSASDSVQHAFPFERLPSELLVRVLQHLELEDAWPLRGVCRAWRAAVESASWTLECRMSPISAAADEFDVPDLVQLAALVRAGKLRLQRLALTLACVHKHAQDSEMQPADGMTAARCSTASANAEIRVSVQRALELLEACSARGLELTNVTAVLIFTCGAGPDNSRVIHGFIERALELLGRGPSAASLRHLTVDAVPVRASELKEASGVEADREILADDVDDTFLFAVWPFDRMSEAPARWRPTAADVARLLRPFRSLRRLSLAPYGGLMTCDAAAALAAALPDLRALRLCPASEEGLAALAPLPLKLFHLGTQITLVLGGADFPVGEGLARLAEGRAGECLESIYLEWSSIRPAGLRALARMPHLKDVVQAAVHPAPGIPGALASLRNSASLAQLHVCLTSLSENPEDNSEVDVAAVLRALAEAAAAPALSSLDLELSGPEIEPEALVALVQAARRPLRELIVQLWERGLTKEEIAAIVDVATADGKLRRVGVECDIESQEDLNILKPLRRLRCNLRVTVDLADVPEAFRRVASRAGMRGVLPKVKAWLERALPNAEIEVQSKLLEEESDPEDW